MVDELTIVYDEYFANVEEEPNGRLEDLPDTFLFRNVLSGLAGSGIHFEKLNVNRQQCLLFSGPSGTGRHTLAEAFIQSICANEYAFDNSYKLILGAEDFMENGITSTGEISEHVEAIFQCARAYSQRGYVFLVFDEMEAYQSLLKLTTALANEMNEEDHRIFLILITEDHGSFCHDLLNKAFLCRCNKPNKRQREKFLESSLKWNVDDWNEPESGLKRKVIVNFPEGNYADLAEKTEGFAYRDLSWLVFSLRAEAALRMNLSTLDGDVCIDIDENTLENYVDAYKDVSSVNTIAYAPFGSYAMSMNPSVGYEGDVRSLGNFDKRKPQEMNIKERMNLILSISTLNEEN